MQRNHTEIWRQAVNYQEWILKHQAARGEKSSESSQLSNEEALAFLAAVKGKSKL